MAAPSVRLWKAPSHPGHPGGGPRCFGLTSFLFFSRASLFQFSWNTHCLAIRVWWDKGAQIGPCGVAAWQSQPSHARGRQDEFLTRTPAPPHYEERVPPPTALSSSFVLHLEDQHPQPPCLPLPSRLLLRLCESCFSVPEEGSTLWLTTSSRLHASSRSSLLQETAVRRPWTRRGARTSMCLLV